MSKQNNSTLTVPQVSDTQRSLCYSRYHFVGRFLSLHDCALIAVDTIVELRWAVNFDTDCVGNGTITIVTKDGWNYITSNVPESEYKAIQTGILTNAETKQL